MPKVKFIFDAPKELETIKLFVSEFKYTSFLPEGLLKDLEDGKDEQIIKNLKNLYKKENIERFEKDWQKIEKKYFELTEKITGRKWAHEEYKVILTQFVRGFCNPYISQVDHVFVEQNIQEPGKNYVVAHELFHTHYFQIIETINDDLRYTEYNENCAVLALLFTETKDLFPYFDEAAVQSCINSDKKAAKHFEKLLKAWEARKSFDDYLEQSLELVKIEYK